MLGVMQSVEPVSPLQEGSGGEDEDFEASSRDDQESRFGNLPSVQNWKQYL